LNQSFVSAPLRQRPVGGSEGWLVAFGEPRPGAALRLFCFPAAGGGAGDYRDWARDCADDVEILAVQLPGRGARMSEAPALDMAWVANRLALAVAGELDRPYALFGHSLGGRTAFAVAQRLAALGQPDPRLVAISSARAPGIGGLNTAALSDSACRLHLKELGGTPPELLDHEEAMALLLPVLRADFALHDDLVAAPERLGCALLACGGESDRLVAEADLAAWRDHTDGPFALTLFPGGHFYLREQREALIELVLREAHAAAARQP
jgi:medium-chain acyl-[acyl-carrier-protein] hydrolase